MPASAPTAALTVEIPPAASLGGPCCLQVDRVRRMSDRTLLGIGCGRCSGETQALLGVERQVSDLLDLIDVDGLRLLWHPSLAEGDLGPVHQALMEGLEPPTLRA